jgi:hypothetical protein
MGEYQELRFRHIASAPEQFVDKMMPALEAYRNGSSGGVLKPIDQARSTHLDKDKMDEFIKERFGAEMIQPLKLSHQTEELHPIESLWDVSVAATAYARTVKHTNEHVALERKAGAVLDFGCRVVRERSVRESASAAFFVFFARLPVSERMHAQRA